ncbi:MAG: hypothetical protein K2W85_16690 [Phycisphaerales bacterium]|nr:hypothetical protein [Phycisphaerales bacterium]
MNTITCSILATTLFAWATAARGALATYEATLTVGPGAWDQVLQAAEDGWVSSDDVPVYALPTGDRFTLRFTVDGSVPLDQRVPADSPLDEHGIFNGTVITAATLTPWASNLGFGLGTDPRTLNFSANRSLLYASQFSTGSRDHFPFTYAFDVSQIFIGVQGPTYSASTIGLGLDQIYGPLTQGRLSVSFGLQYVSEGSFFIGFDASEFRLVPAPGAAALLALAAVVSSRRRR